MRVVHVITGLAVGGAESMLVKLLAAMDRDRFDPEVVSLMSGGPNRDALAGLGVPVHELGMKAGIPGYRVLSRLVGLAGNLAPDIIQGWMYHGNLAATWMATRVPSRTELFWNIRHSVDDIRDEKLLTRGVIRLGARLSNRPRAIVCNSGVSVRQHAGLGYLADGLVMIPNGFDLDRFRPDVEARRAVREELGLPADAPVVGIVARRHPMKGHADFLRMAATIKASRPDTRFLMVGRGLDQPDAELDALVAGGGLEAAVCRVGSRTDVPAVMAALDVLVLASTFGEGFPNVLGEAMACGVPCVTTDVGDAAVVVGDLGMVVEKGNPEGLARGVEELLALDPDVRSALAARCRERIADHYSLASIARRYEDLYETGS